MNPNSRNPFVRFAAQHSALEWLGVGLAILPLALAAYGGPQTVVQWLAVFLAGVISTLIVVSVLRFGTRRDALAAKDLEHRFTLRGPRGEHCTAVATLRLESQSEYLPSFLSEKRKSSGQVRSKKIKYRNHRKNQISEKLEYLALDDEHIDEVHDLNGETLVYIRPPDIVRRGELIELVTEEVIEGCFSDDAEFVEKEVIFPISRLKFELHFTDTEAVDRATGTVTALGMSARAEPLLLVKSGSVTKVTWEVEDARPGDRCRVTWVWGERSGG